MINLGDYTVSSDTLERQFLRNGGDAIGDRGTSAVSHSPLYSIVHSKEPKGIFEVVYSAGDTNSSRITRSPSGLTMFGQVGYSTVLLLHLFHPY